MCCFAGPATPIVYGTSIFARTLGEEATIVYSLKLSVEDAVAMILPVPIARGRSEDALVFESLEGYPDFFADMELGFPPPAVAGFARDGLAPQPAPLKVHAVGAYEASFVPSLRDFDRLDPRFRLADDVWRKLPQYADWGFALFRLAPGKETKVHPMAFRFPTRRPDLIFFPTVHVHDGTVHDTAEFRHALYYQTAQDRPPREWGTFGPAATFMKVEKAGGLVDPNRPVFKRQLWGVLPNRDYLVNERTNDGPDRFQH